MRSPQKNSLAGRARHPLVVGTFVLTLTGFVSRIIGFFYRIYLSRLFGEEGMGIYQLLNPVLALSFALTAAGFQTAISKFVAQAGASGTSLRGAYRPMILGLSLSVPLSALSLAVIYLGAEPIAVGLLMEPRCAPMLRILAFSIPPSAIHGCINGYFYGKKKASIPAFTQLLEQCCRVGCVYLLASCALGTGRQPTVSAAVLGLTVGEFLSMTATVAAIYIQYARDLRSPARKAAPSPLPAGFPQAGRITYRMLLGMVVPLTANRIVLGLLQSLETVTLPASLRAYGYDTATSLSVYGVLTGMAFPLIFFPNAITGSVSVLLLPLISESRARGDLRSVRRYTLRTIRLCGLLGLLCMTFFLIFGQRLGELLFHSPLAGYFITVLGFLCPFLYLDNTLSSILQGLGMAARLFLMNVSALVLRLLFVFLAVPRMGIRGYLYGLLAGQMALCSMYLLCLYRAERRLSPKTSPAARPGPAAGKS